MVNGKSHLNVHKLKSWVQNSYMHDPIGFAKHSLINCITKICNSEYAQ